MICSVEPVPIRGKIFFAVIADLPDIPAMGMLAFYWPGLGWCPSAFTVDTGLAVDLAGLADPRQVPFDPPYEIEAPCSREAVVEALALYQAHCQGYLEGRKNGDSAVEE
jgi:hypothetical protein